jgi:hypothetical protein
MQYLERKQPVGVDLSRFEYGADAPRAKYFQQFVTLLENL